MALYAQDEYAERNLAGPGWRFVLCWVLATVVGSEAGRVAADRLSQLPLGVAAKLPDLQILGGIAIGLCIVLAQALVLLRYLKWRGALAWIGATVLGRTIRMLVISFLLEVLFSRTPSQACGAEFLVVIISYFAVMMIVGAAAGAAVGIPQRFVLERRVAHARWWVWANVAASVVTFIAIASILYSSIVEVLMKFRDDGSDISMWYSPYSSPLTLDVTFSVLNDIFVGVVTGYVLMNILRHPTTRAEWSVKLRDKRQRLPKRFAETQPSSEALLEQERK